MSIEVDLNKHQPQISEEEMKKRGDLNLNGNKEGNK